MSSLLDVPAQLTLALSLAAATAAAEPPRAPAATLPPPAAAAALVPEPIAGPYRFGESMWLRALKEDLPRDAHGYAQGIFRTSGGRYYVPRQTERRAILAARDDGALAARAARAFARSNARALRASLGRTPTAGDLYVAHLFGPEAAAHLIARARSHPGELATNYAPELAEKAAELFGARKRSLTLVQLYTKLTEPLAHIKARAIPPEPSIADLLQRGATWGALRPNAVAWPTEISSAVPSQ